MQHKSKKENYTNLNKLKFNIAMAKKGKPFERN